MSAQSNERNPLIVVVDVGSPSSDLLIPACYIPRKSVLVGAYLMNGASIAASNTDYVQLELKAGSTVVAEIDTRAAHENGLTANVAKALNLVSGEEDLAAGTSLSVNYNETDSGTAVALTNAKLVLHLWQKETA